MAEDAVDVLRDWYQNVAERLEINVAALGYSYVVEEMSHRDALLKAPADYSVFWYRHCGRLFRCHRGKLVEPFPAHLNIDEVDLAQYMSYIIIDHQTKGYNLSNRLRHGAGNLTAYKAFEVLGILIKRKLPLETWVFECLSTFSPSMYYAKRTMVARYNDLMKGEPV